MRAFKFVIKQVIKQSATVEAHSRKEALSKLKNAPLLDSMVEPAFENYKSAVTYGKVKVEPATICKPSSWRKARGDDFKGQTK